MREAGDPHVLGKGGIAMAAVNGIRITAGTIAMNRLVDTGCDGV